MSSKLTRHLRFWDSVAISVGIVIGVGIFRTPAQIARYLDSPSLILMAWIVGAVISLLGVLCYAELSSRFPETGGTYVFLREAYGKFTGFVYGWAEFSINRAASIAAVSYILAAYLRNFVPYAAESEKWIALATVIFFTWINIIGIHFGVKVQNVLSIFKVAAMVLMAAAVFLFSPSQGLSVSAPSLTFSSFKHFAPALIPILWSYGGWHESTFMSGEFQDTKKELPWSLIVSALIVAALYLLMNAAYLRVMTPAEMIQSKAIASDVLNKLFGAKGSLIIAAAIIFSAAGALNSTILTGGRVPFAVGQDAHRLKWMGEIHPKFKTPLRSLLINGTWASILILWGNFERLLFFNAFEIWLFFILAGIAVFILREKSKAGNFLMFGYPWVPLLFTLVSVWLCLTTILEAPKEAFFGFLIILAGAPLYYFVVRR